MSQTTLLKIKIKSLAYETHIIHREENKCRRQERWAMGKHIARKLEGMTHNQITRIEHALAQRAVRDQNRELRLNMRSHRLALRPVQRYAQLAYGYMRGMPYARIEHKHTVAGPINRALLTKEVTRFGGDAEGIEAWLTPAEDAQVAA